VKKAIWIGLAGALGAILRTVIGFAAETSSMEFPIATLIVNLVGTFLLCFLVTGAVKILQRSETVEKAVMTGFLGSFTTFSALSMETVLLMENQQYGYAFWYVSLSILGGVSVGVIGFALGRKWLSA